MLRLLTDPRIHLDPTRADRLSAILVLSLCDALDLRDEADRLAARHSRED